MNIYPYVKLTPFGIYPTNIRCKKIYLRGNAIALHEKEKNWLEIAQLSIDKGLVKLCKVHLYNGVSCSSKNIEGIK